ncbi:MAG: homoserine O-acetyltransferase [Bacteroidota bacterium]
MDSHQYHRTDAFPLENGASLPEFHLAYTTYGTLNATRNNVVWVCHALTANAEVSDWWEGLFGAGKLFSPEKDFIVCANMLGSCYGSTHALSTNPETGTPYFHEFPLLTNRDIVRAFDALRQHLGIDRIKVVIGGSMGGQQLLEWNIMQPDVFEYAIPMATNAQHSPWGIAFNESQRMAIAADQSWKEASPNAGMEGMKAARSVALLSYRNYDTYHNSQQEKSGQQPIDRFRASSYQQYQGQKLADRFNAFSYWTLSKAMDSQDVGRGRGSKQEALANIQAKTLVISISSDLLFPPSEQAFLAGHIPHATLATIDSFYGHDGFLLEYKQMERAISRFLS